MPCMARRTHWVNTRFRIDSGFTVSHIVLCGKETSGTLCQKCANRRRDNTRDQSAMLHGLLTEPIPENSFIYGGPVFWAKMNKFRASGKVLSTEAVAWITRAEAAQDAAEAIGGCKVKRLSDKESMPKTKEKTKEKAKTFTMSLKTIFAPIEVRFTESEKPPVKMETDSMNIRLEVIDGKSVWVAENGMRFEDVKGEPGELIVA